MDPVTIPVTRRSLPTARRTNKHGQTTYYLRSREPSAACHTTDPGCTVLHRAAETEGCSHRPDRPPAGPPTAGSPVRPLGRGPAVRPAGLPDRPAGRPPDHTPAHTTTRGPVRPPTAPVAVPPTRLASRGQWTPQCTLGTVAAQRRPRMQEHAQVAVVDHGQTRLHPLAATDAYRAQSTEHSLLSAHQRLEPESRQQRQRRRCMHRHGPWHRRAQSHRAQSAVEE